MAWVWGGGAQCGMGVGGRALCAMEIHQPAPDQRSVSALYPSSMCCAVLRCVVLPILHTTRCKPLRGAVRGPTYEGSAEGLCPRFLVLCLLSLPLRRGPLMRSVSPVQVRPT